MTAHHIQSELQGEFFDCLFLRYHFMIEESNLKRKSGQVIIENCHICVALI